VAAEVVFPNGGPFFAFEMGSVFNFPNAGTDTLTIDSVGFTYYVPSYFVGNDIQTLRANIYEYDNSNGVFDPSSLTLRGISPVTLSGLLGAIGTYQNAIATNFVDPATGGFMPPLQDNKQYYVSILINPSLFGQGSYFDWEDAVYFGVETTRNYHLNLTTHIPTPQTTPIMIADAWPRNVYWYGGGFGLDMAPSIGLHLSVSPCMSEKTLTQTICAGDSIVVNNVVYNSSVSGVTQQIYGGILSACDSSVVINLTVENAIDNSVSVLNNIIKANQIGATYQWIDCNNGNAAISGATDSSYAASVNGDYAVVITVNSCSDTSDCTNIMIVGVDENAFGNQFVVSPNPALNNIVIDLGDTKNINISIINIIGKVVYSKVNINDSRLDVSLKELGQGVYFVRIENENQQKVIKLIKH